MSIPFYRFVRHEDDGITVYECLQCNAGISIGGAWFGPSFCWNCGVRFKGFIIPKPWKYISLARSEKLVFVVQETRIKIGRENADSKNLYWKDYGSSTDNLKKAIKNKKHAEEQEEFFEKNQPGFNTRSIYRIVTKKEDNHGGTVCIDIRKYFQKTGKIFNSQDYQRFFQPWEKEI